MLQWLKNQQVKLPQIVSQSYTQALVRDSPTRNETSDEVTRLFSQETSGRDEIAKFEERASQNDS